MVLIGEHDQFAGNALGLEDVERRETFGYGETVVEFAVDDLFRRKKKRGQLAGGLLQSRILVCVEVFELTNCGVAHSFTC